MREGVFHDNHCHWLVLVFAEQVLSNAGTLLSIWPDWTGADWHRNGNGAQRDCSHHHYILPSTLHPLLLLYQMLIFEHEVQKTWYVAVVSQRTLLVDSFAAPLKPNSAHTVSWVHPMNHKRSSDPSQWSNLTSFCFSSLRYSCEMVPTWYSAVSALSPSSSCLAFSCSHWMSK